MNPVRSLEQNTEKLRGLKKVIIINRLAAENNS